MIELAILVIVVCSTLLFYMIWTPTQKKKIVQQKPFIQKEFKKRCTSNLQIEKPSSFVPVEDRIVPTHASYSNKMNDMIGNMNAELVTPGFGEIVVPSDWYMKRELPTEYDGAYWPPGGIVPDFLYPGSDPNQPLRNQNWQASYGKPSMGYDD